MAIWAQQPHVFTFVVGVIAVAVVNFQRHTSSQRVALAPAAERAPFSALGKQESTNVPRNASDASADDFTAEPLVDELRMFVIALALVAAEPRAISIDRLAATKAARTRPRHAWFHAEL